MADKHQAFVEENAVLEKQRDDIDKARNASNAHIRRGSPGRHAKVADLVMSRSTKLPVLKPAPGRTSLKTMPLLDSPLQTRRCIFNSNFHRVEQQP